MKYNIFNVLAQNVLIVYGIEIIISVFVIIFSISLASGARTNFSVQNQIYFTPFQKYFSALTIT